MPTSPDMSAIRHIRPSLAVGADLGGTRLRVVATRDGRVTARLTTRAPRLEDLEKFLHSVWATRGWTRHDQRRGLRARPSSPRPPGRGRPHRGPGPGRPATCAP